MWLRTLHIAGMLHDIGKIGIPDAILRKPAPLTADEYDIVKQHVALGHMIVRDLPNLDLVRSGIRFHHEQWNGQGYLERIYGEEIPLVGAHPRRGRRDVRHDHIPHLPQGTAAARGAPPLRGCRR